MRPPRRSRVRLIVLTLVLSLGVTCVQLAGEYRLQRLRLEDTINLHISNIADSVIHAVEEVYGVHAMVIGANGQRIDLETVGGQLGRNRSSPYLRCIVLAPGGVVDQVYPGHGLEALIGQDLYAQDYPTGSYARQARDTDALVVTPPFQLPSGELVISARLPVNVYKPDGSRESWGMVCACVSFPDMLGRLDSDALASGGYHYRISLGEEEGYRPILEQGLEDGTPSLTRDFSLGSMKLRLEAAPGTGWLRVSRVLLIFGVTVLAVCVLGTLTELLLSKLRRLLRSATEDALTGLLNRGAGQRQIEQRLRRGIQGRAAFLLMDLDYFKNVNDHLGHQHGDFTLMACAQILRQLFRKEDVLCRLGGDEFVVFLESREMGFLNTKIERLLSAMRRDVVGGGESVPISCSMGVAIAPEDGMTFEALYSRADQALYRAKKKGRNQAVFARDELAEAESE